MHSNAAILYNVEEDLIVDTLSLSEPRRGEVLIKMGAAGICHSDVHVISGQAKQKLPCVLGHEGVGTVIDKGEEVSSVRVGDQVVLSWLPYCRKCHQCERGRTHLCQAYEAVVRNGTLMDGSCRFKKNGEDIRQLGALGCWAEYIVVPEECCVSINKRVPFDVAALLGCAVTTGVGAVINRAKVQSGDIVVIIGVGGVGLSLLMGAKLQGAAKIICIDTSNQVKELAHSLGCTDFILAEDSTDVGEKIKLLTGIGADHVFEAVGKSSLQQAALDYCCPGGQVAYVGLDAPNAQISLPTTDITRSEKIVTGSIYGSACTDRDFISYAANYLQGTLPVEKLITGYYSLDQVNKGIQHMLKGGTGRGIIFFK